jgi:hypothetical protein
MSTNQDHNSGMPNDASLVDVLDSKPGGPKSAGLAVIDITHTIPTTGRRKVTTKWEYWTYCAFCEYYM